MYVRAQQWMVVRGNHEFYYLDFGTERAIPGCEDPDRWGQLHWLLEHIAPGQGQYLAMLPDDCTFFLPGTAPLRVAHGVPGRNRTGFYRSQSDAAIAAEIMGVREHTLVSAHTHVQIDRHITADADILGRPGGRPACRRGLVPAFHRGRSATGMSSTRAAWGCRWTTGRWRSLPSWRACRKPSCAAAGA